MNRTKKTVLSLLALLCCIIATAQTAATKCEYWIDRQMDSRITTVATAGEWTAQIDLSSLPTGVHSIAFRAGMDDGRWSSIHTKFFVVPQTHSTEENVLANYEYWIDRKYDERKSGTFGAGGIVDTDLDLTSLSPGLHNLSFRVLDTNGHSSSTLTKYFLVPQATSTEENVLANYEYWIDRKYDERKSGTFGAGGIVDTDLDLTSLPPGLHNLSFRVLDTNGHSSSTLTKYFMVPQASSTTENSLVNYRYWIDKDIENAVEETIAASGIVNLDIDLTTLAPGLHSISCQVKDEQGHYSPALLSYFMVPADPAELVIGDKIVAYEYWFNDNPRKRVEVEPTATLTIDEAQLVVDGVEIESIPADYEFDVATNNVMCTQDITFGLQVFNNLGTGSSAITQEITGYKKAVDTHMLTLVSEQESTLAAPTGCNVQGYKFDCTIGDKLYWFMDLAEGSNVDFYNADGTKIEAEAIGQETIGGKQALTITATSAAVYALVYGATSVGAQNIVKVVLPIVITINNAERKYGAENPTFTYTSAQQGSIVGTPTFITDADETSPVGEYAITLNMASIANEVVTVNNGTLTVTKADGYISYEVASVSKTYGDAAFVNPLTVSGDGDVTYTTSNAAVAAVDATTGEVTIVGAGEAVITATITDADEGNYTYATTTASYAVGVNTATIQVVATNYFGTYDGKAHGINVTVNKPSGATVKYGETEGTYNLDVCPTYTNANTYTIYYQVTKPNYTTVTGSAVVLIEKADAVINFANASVGKTYGDAQFINALTNSGDGSVIYASDNSSVATVDVATGLVTITGSGEANITATVIDGANYTYATKTATFTVGVSNAAMDIAANGYTGTYDGKAHGINVKVNVPEDAVVMYGTVEGTYDLVASPEFTNAGNYTVYYQVTKPNYNTVTNSAVVSINKAVGSISYEVTSIEKMDTDAAFTNELTMTGDGSVTYASDNVNVATVNEETGEITITGIGDATITATVTDGTNYTYTTKTARYALKVTLDPATSINVVSTDDADNSGDWYTLGGQRLNAKPNKQGVYVRDGRKVVVK